MAEKLEVLSIAAMEQLLDSGCGFSLVPRYFAGEELRSGLLMKFETRTGILNFGVRLQERKPRFFPLWRCFLGIFKT